MLRPNAGFVGFASRRLAVLAAGLLCALAALTGAAAADSGAVPRMHFDRNMRRVNVCFTVTNPAGTQSVLFGQRFTDRTVNARTPAIVLVHGVASSTQNWDYSPTWSVARALAQAGYVVISYDRLGYAKSPYDEPNGGLQLTIQAQRDILHQVVGEVKSGAYSTTTGRDCSGPQRPSQLLNPTVAIIGHSAGGWVVAGYPGQYHDVAAMVQADITAAVSIGPGKGGQVTPDPARPDYFQFFQTRQDCETFDLWERGVVPYVGKIACTPPFPESPLGEVADLATAYAQNQALIAKIGPSIPVLLTYGDHDIIVPTANARAELAYYQANCGCDASEAFLGATGHLFMAHKSLPIWVHDVVHFLRSHGIRAKPPLG